MSGGGLKIILVGMSCSKKNISRNVGNGEHTFFLFWKDKWLGEVPL
jgi:hypothetical protein